MLKLFYKRLKDQTGEIFLTVLAITGLISLGASIYSFYSFGKEAEKTMQESEDVTKYGAEKYLGDPSKAHKKNTEIFVGNFVKGVQAGLGAVVPDDTLILTLANEAGVFKLEKNKENVNNEEKPKENLDEGIKKMVERKVELNSKSETTPQEAKTIVTKIIQDVQKDEINNNNNNKTKIIKLDSKIQDTLKAKGKLADQKLIDLRKALKRNQLSYDYNNKILEKYKEFQDEGYGITDTADLAEAKRRLEDANNEIKIIEAQIKELEDAKQISPETTVAETTPETTPDTAAATQPTETTPETTPDTALPSELNLKGTITTVGKYDTTVKQITLNINFETQIVSGTYSYSGPSTWTLTDGSLPEVHQTTENGTINGKIDINSKIINAIISGTGTADGWIGSYSINLPMSGSLDENNNASGTIDASGPVTISNVWSASPY